MSRPVVIGMGHWVPKNPANPPEPAQKKLRLSTKIPQNLGNQPTWSASWSDPPGKKLEIPNPQKI